MFAVLTDSFSKFESGSQLCSYAGLYPAIKNGSSENEPSRISKIGNQKLRNYSSCVPLILVNTMRL
jgi:hypothetical protein